MYTDKEQYTVVDIYILYIYILYTTKQQETSSNWNYQMRKREPKIEGQQKNNSVMNMMMLMATTLIVNWTMTQKSVSERCKR